MRVQAAMEVRMRTILILTCAGLAAACSMNQPADPRAAEASSEALSKALAGYEPAGPPVSCVPMRDLRGNRSAGDAIVFDGLSSATIYVNRPPGGCPSLDFGRALVTRTSISQLCRGDIADVVDPSSRTNYGGCALGDFEPYRRVAR
jgi:hypothetical protein